MCKILCLYQNYEKKIEWDELNDKVVVLDNVFLLFGNLFIIVLILYNIFIITQIPLKYILNFAGFILCKINNLIAFLSQRLFRINSIDDHIDDIIFHNNYILGNIIRILSILFYAAIILYNIIFILIIIFDSILEISNNFIFKIYDSLVNIFDIYRLCEQSSLEKIYENKLNNFILINILLGIFLLMFQLILICYSLILIP